MRTQSEIQTDESIDNMGEFLEAQEIKWECEINEIMMELGINHYPTNHEFKLCDKNKLHQTIRSYMGHDLMSERMGLIDKTTKNIGDRLMDAMLRIGINYYPDEERFRKVNNSLYEKIALKYGHEEFRKKMKLLTKHEYENLQKKRRG